jgi:ornithine decarboxylase
MMDVRTDALMLEAATPSLVLDFAVIAENYRQFEEHFPSGMVYYAVKANSNPDILRLVVNRGGGLEIASLPELEKAQQAGADGAHIICSNPIKSPIFLQRMQTADVFAVVVDSTHEVEKVARHMPGARVYVRLAVDNSGAVMPLDGKFGVDAELALELCDMARDMGLLPIGLSFHVGSQCLSVQNFGKAVAACGAVWRDAVARGHDFFFLDIGGGFPAGHYHDPSIPTIAAIGAEVERAIAEHIPPTEDLMMVMEPGRGLSGEAGRLVTTVTGLARRGQNAWAYLDAGVFNGLMETFEGFPPVVYVLGDDVASRPVNTYTIAGPSCDSNDVVARNYELPELRIGDRLVFIDVGAYTNEYAVPFNGFPIPEVIALNTEHIEAPLAESDLLPA